MLFYLLAEVIEINTQSLFGPVGGFVIAAASYLSPFGEVVFTLILAISGVDAPLNCWQAIDESSSNIASVCYPYSDPISLLFLSNLLVAGAIGLIVWFIISSSKKSN
ncbi:MAG: hypothetical protein J0L96_11210 [Anaerolineae bacterium]|nr:hypothetical protein [Anaerolineae bacterium]